MWIMRFLLKILVLPLLLAVDAATLITKVSIYVGCYVVGFAVWLCGIFCILSIIFKMIPCAIFFAAILIVMFACLFAAANIQLFLESAHRVLKRV
ncbi:hypothetical protein SAMN02910451_00680 [Butyrivibrio hungatei]|uniref:Uncharacterized protein n=1 Tax=Butyrivibrio hungatei TaxID=185008 RepID=A0A1G5BE58_9FIRM|nr:hypothetical protein [Butyrivibrio hungatei]SCX88386.1 hypothetical protein SAMN02910451_00680 [Butyrivibrio hungatei]